MRQKVLFFVSPKISAKKIGVIKKMFAKHLDSSVYETIFSHEMDRSGDGKLVANNYEAVVTVGGDGTLLKACHEFHNQITPPIISFNAGNMGFLVPFSSSSMQHKAIEYIVSNDSTRKRLGFLTKKYSRGLATLYRNNKKVESRNFLNEIYFCKNLVGRAARFEIGMTNESDSSTNLSSLGENSGLQENGNINNCYSADIDRLSFKQFVCDGLIVSTAIGSTGYNLAIGGPLVDSSLQDHCLILALMNAHSLTYKPLTLGTSLQKRRNSSENEKQNLESGEQASNSSIRKIFVRLSSEAIDPVHVFLDGFTAWKLKPPVYDIPKTSNKSFPYSPQFPTVVEDTDISNSWGIGEEQVEESNSSNDGSEDSEPQISITIPEDRFASRSASREQAIHNEVDQNVPKSDDLTNNTPFRSPEKTTKAINIENQADRIDVLEGSDENLFNGSNSGVENKSNKTRGIDEYIEISMCDDYLTLVKEEKDTRRNDWYDLVGAVLNWKP